MMRRRWAGVSGLLLFALLLGWGLSARAAEVQFPDPGFEDELAGAAWALALNGSGDAVVEFDRAVPGSGLKALKFHMPTKPAQPVVVGQTVDLGDVAPTALFVRYMSSKAGGSRLVLRGAAADGDDWKVLAETTLSAATGSYRLHHLPLTIGDGIRRVRVELQAVDTGVYLFDDVRLDYTPPTVAGVPDTLLFLGPPDHFNLDETVNPVLDRLRETGWSRIQAVSFDRVSAEDIRRARLIVVLANYGSARLTPSQHQLDLKQALVEYVRAGGGLIIAQDLTQQLSAMWFRFLLMREFGGRILLESPLYAKGDLVKVGEYDDDRFAYTTDIRPPLNEGVTRMVVQGSDIISGAMTAQLAFLPGPDWQVAMAVPLPSTLFNHEKELGLSLYEKECRAEGFADSTPLVGVREFGKGRVAYFGLQSFLFTRDFSSPAVRAVSDAYLTKGLPGGEPSDTLRFIENMFNWTAANSGNLEVAAIPDLFASADYDRSLDASFKMFRGVIGPRTTHSSGQSTPAEYVAKAKEMGLDYIVFLEEFAALSPEAYEALWRECAELTDDRFTAIAGFTYVDEFGQHEYIFSFDPLYPGKRLLTEDGKRFLGIDPKEKYGLGLEYIYTLLGFNNNAGWFRFHDAPYATTDLRAVQSMGVMTQEDGRTVEDATDVFALNNRNGQGLFPQAIVLAKSAGELDGLLNGTYFQTVVGHEGLAGFRRMLMRHGGAHRYPEEGSTGETSITSGPLVRFDMPRGDIHARGLYDTVAHYWPYTLAITSDHGLSTVELLDGDQVVRVFRPGGAKQFNHEGLLSNERQKHLWIRATDSEGGLAMTRAIGSNNFMLREFQCADRMNQLPYSIQDRPDGEPPMLGIHAADTCMPDKGAWIGHVRPAGFFAMDEKLGISAKGNYDGAAGNAPMASLMPNIFHNGVPGAGIGWQMELVTGLEGGYHNQPHRVVSSANALVGERILDGVFDMRFKPVIHVWHSLYPLAGPSRYLATTARKHLYLPKVDGVVFYWWEQDLEILQDIPTDGGKPVVSVGTVGRSRGTVDEVSILKGERKSHNHNADYDIDPGDALVIVDPVWGSLAVMPLSDNLTYRRGRLFVRPDGEDTIKAGTKYRVRLLCAGIHRFVEDPVALAEQVAKAYATDGAAPTVYKVETPVGKVTGTQYSLDLEADGGAVTGKITGIAALPGNLASRVSGLRDDYSAVVALPDRMRIVPVEQGVSFITFTNEEDGKDLFVGHPFVTENADLDLFIAMDKDRKTWVLEIHNPTETDIEATVVNHPAFTMFAFNRTVTVPAGASASFPLAAK